MKKPFELVAEIEEKDAEIERLKKEETKALKELQALARLVDSLIAEKGAEIERLKALCARAADALGPYALGFPDGSDIRALIAELRKAAE